MSRGPRGGRGESGSTWCIDGRPHGEEQVSTGMVRRRFASSSSCWCRRQLSVVPFIVLMVFTPSGRVFLTHAAVAGQADAVSSAREDIRIPVDCQWFIHQVLAAHIMFARHLRVLHLAWRDLRPGGVRPATGPRDVLREAGSDGFESLVPAAGSWPLLSTTSRQVERSVRSAQADRRSGLLSPCLTPRRRSTSCACADEVLADNSQELRN